MEEAQWISISKPFPPAQLLASATVPTLEEIHAHTSSFVLSFSDVYLDLLFYWNHLVSREIVNTWKARTVLRSPGLSSLCDGGGGRGNEWHQVMLVKTRQMAGSRRAVCRTAAGPGFR